MAPLAKCFLSFAGLAAVAVVAAVGMPQSAVAQDIHVGNFKVGGEQQIRLGNRNDGSGRSYMLAQEFTLGGQMDDELFFLDEVEVYLGGAANNPGGIIATIHPADPENPAYPAPYAIGTFNKNASWLPRSGRTHQNFARDDAPIPVLGNTKYFLVLRVPQSERAGTTRQYYDLLGQESNNENSDTTGGFSIGDNYVRGNVPAGGGAITWQRGEDNRGSGRHFTSLEFTLRGEEDNEFASNWDITGHGIDFCNNPVGNNNESGRFKQSWVGQGFTVGGTAGQRYVVHDVIFGVGRYDVQGVCNGCRGFCNQSCGQMEVRIHTKFGINPSNTVVGSFVKTRRPGGSFYGQYNLWPTSRSGILLNARQEYFVAFDPQDVDTITGPGVFQRNLICMAGTGDGSEDSTNTSGWSIANSYRAFSVGEPGVSASGWFASNLNNAADGVGRGDHQVMKFRVRASLINEAPVARTIPVMRLRPSGSEGSATVNLNSTFLDPENETLLGYRANCANTGIATINISGGTATVQAAGAGNTTCSIRTWDSIGKTVQATFPVTVNTAPTKGDTIAPRTLQAGLTPANTRDVGIITAYRDADGDTLAYTIESNSAPNLVNATISGSIITLTAVGLGLGEAELTVRATDPAGEFFEQTFTVTVQPPPPPQLTAPPEQRFNANLPITPLQFPERTPNTGLPPFAYSLNPVPAGLNFDANTRTLSGTPTMEMAGGVYTYAVRDSQGRVGTANFNAAVQMPLACFNSPAACISNLNQTTVAADTVDVGGGTAYMQAFTAPGGPAQSFQLNDVTLAIRGFNGAPAALAVAIHAENDAGTGPAASPLATLSGPAMPRPTAEAAFTYAAAAGVVLRGGGSYYIAPSSSGGAGNEYQLAVTASANEDQQVSPGWSIADAYLADGSAASPARALKLRVRATPMPGTGNLGRPPHGGGFGVGEVGANRHRIAQPFTTGGAPFYLLQDVAVALASTTTGSPGALQISIHAPDSATPANPAAAPLVVLNGTPASPQAVGEYTYASGGGKFHLSGNTEYFLVAASPQGSGLYTLQTVGAMDDLGGGVGWSIADMARVESGGNPWGNFTATLAMRIRATVETGANTPPAAVGTIADVELAGERDPAETVVVDLSTIFMDPDGDHLGYGLTNSAPAAVSTRLNGDAVTVIAEGDGAAEIRITATDGRGASANQSFIVTVTDPSCSGSGICVSNFGADAGWATIGRDSSGILVSGAQGFTTGGTSAQTFWLSDVTLAMGRIAPASDVQEGEPGPLNVAIHEAAAGGGPSTTVVATLSGPRRPRGAADNFFYTVPGESAQLLGGTEYFVVLSIPDPGSGGVSGSVSNVNYRQRATTRTAEDEGSTAGWSIADSNYQSNNNTAWGPQPGRNWIMRVRAVPGPANNPPLAVKVLPAPNLNPGASSTVDLSPAFTDIDGDEISFAAESDATSVATVNVQGATLTVTAVAQGAATVSVTATDGRGGSTTASFAVSVNPASGACEGAAYCASNLNQTPLGMTNLVGRGNAVYEIWAQSFTPAGTGSFALRDVSVAIANVNGAPGDLNVTLHAEPDASTVLGPASAVLATLTGMPARPRTMTAAVFTFAAPPGTLLTGGDTYFVRFQTPNLAARTNYELMFTNNIAAEDAGSNWTIGDDAHSSRDSGASYSEFTGRPVQIRVRAVAATTVPRLSLPAIVPQSYSLFDPIAPLQLPQAANGSGNLSYTITPDLPAGLTFNAAANPPTISGAPAALTDRNYTYAVRDGTGATATAVLPLAVSGGCAGELYCISTLHLPDFVGPFGTRVIDQWGHGSAQPLEVGGSKSDYFLIRDAVVDFEHRSGNVELRYSIHPVLDNGHPDTNTTFGVLVHPENVSGGGRRLRLLVPESPVALQGATRYLIRADIGLSNYVWASGDAGETGNPGWGLPREHVYDSGFGFVVNGPSSARYYKAKMRLRADPTTLPTLGAVPPLSFTAGITVSPPTPLPVASAGNPPYRYSITPPLPAGLTFNAAANPPTISGTPQAAAATAPYVYTAMDNSGLSAMQHTFTITVAGIPPRAPRQPAPPALMTGSPSDTRIDASWAEPPFPNPAISGYTLRYRSTAGTPGAWAEIPVAGAQSRTAVISSLSGGLEYEVQVRGINSAGNGDWSASARHTTEAVGNHRPMFSAAAYTFTLAENSAAGALVGVAAATDLDAADTISYTLTGAAFTAGAGGRITVAAGADLDFETTPAYTLTLTARDPRGAYSAAAVNINLSNVAEVPLATAAPMLAEGQPSRSAIAVSWTAAGVPAGAPPVSTYTLRHRSGGGGWVSVDAGGGTSTVLSGLQPMTAYEVQVRAVNADGAAPWSAGATHRTEVNQIGERGIVYADTLQRGRRGHYIVGSDHSNLLEAVAAFTTGNAPGGYALRRALIRVNANLFSSRLRVSVLEQNAGGTGPGAEIAALQGPERPDPGTHIYEHPLYADPVTLNANSTYYLRLQSPGTHPGGGAHVQIPGNDGSGALSNDRWTIGNTPGGFSGAQASGFRIEACVVRCSSAPEMAVRERQRETERETAELDFENENAENDVRAARMDVDAATTALARANDELITARFRLRELQTTRITNLNMNVNQQVSAMRAAELARLGDLNRDGAYTGADFMLHYIARFMRGAVGDGAASGPGAGTPYWRRILMAPHAPGASTDDALREILRRANELAPAPAAPPPAAPAAPAVPAVPASAAPDVPASAAPAPAAPALSDDEN